VDTVRDLGCDDPWQESLERSRARRNASRRQPVSAPPRTRTRAPSRRRFLVRRSVAVFALVASIAVPLTASAGGAGHALPVAATPPALPASAQAQYLRTTGAGPLSAWPISELIRAGLSRTCQPTSGPSNYVNPLAGARVKPERIDQGVDYAGSGPLVAIGAGTVTYVATTDTGWPGSFIEYRLIDGPDAGCYVYYAEGVNPAAGLRVGDSLAPGQRIASIIAGWPTGIELGWGAGTSTATYAAETHQWTAASDEDSVASAAGKSFSALIASLGGPPGKVEG
jgi:murein DD-endopeptidase MepM/ murein hydrolase activator NlpD